MSCSTCLWPSFFPRPLSRKKAAFSTSSRACTALVIRKSLNGERSERQDWWKDPDSTKRKKFRSRMSSTSWSNLSPQELEFISTTPVTPTPAGKHYDLAHPTRNTRIFCSLTSTLFALATLFMLTRIHYRARINETFTLNDGWPSYTRSVLHCADLISPKVSTPLG